MTINATIAVVNALLSLTLVILGALCIWQARHRLLRWPATALVALGGLFVGCGLVFGQTVLFRMTWDPYPFGDNSPGTLAIRLIVLVIVAGLLLRVIRGNLLTTTDRERLRTEASP